MFAPYVEQMRWSPAASYLDLDHWDLVEPDEFDDGGLDIDWLGIEVDGWGVMVA